MAQRFNVVLSDDLSKQLEELAKERETTKGDVVARALQLYAAAFKGRKEGLAVGVADPKTLELKREFVGL
ncbi:putative transcriptional regulator [Pseudacidovorax sp. 1753]|uniref:transcriptional regulator n=1 Tax=Pseudacidovorax sp. 1753 TaxID=3156419 RepID=UPI0033930E28